MKTKNLLLILAASILMMYCKKETSSVEQNYQLSGYVQKGPFINGTSISVYELNEKFLQTGKVYNTQIADNKGSFSLQDITLHTNYVSLKADGFYFNEITGKQSAAQITLYAIADVSNNKVNVNILSHLEKSRVEYLVSQGKSFFEAKVQAQKEVLAIFNIVKNDISASEKLDISKTGEDNAILLAVSLILQGYRTEGELSELLSNISTDIREDGILNSTSLGSALINHAKSLDTTGIKSNLIKRYNELGVTDISAPPFGKHIENFIKNTSFVATQSPIKYPEVGLNGDNILSLTKTSYASSNYSLAAELPIGASLKIIIKQIAKSPLDSAAGGAGYWFYVGGSEYNWSISLFDNTSKKQTFTAIEAGKSCELNMLFDLGTFAIEYYEMNAITPTRVKTITVTGK